MAAITLTPVDITTAPVVVNTDIIYHVFTINGVTRVFYGKGGKSPYQVDVQESAASIAAASSNLVEVTTINGSEYLFIGSGGTGDGKGIMFIETDGSGSKILFKYNEESAPIIVYSSDSSSVIAGRINALTPSPTPSGQILTQTVSVSAAQGSTLNTAPVTLIPGVPGKSIGLVSVYFNFVGGLISHANVSVITTPTSVVNASSAFVLNESIYASYGSGSFAPVYNITGSNWVYSPAAGDPVILYQNADAPTDCTYEFTLAYFLF